MALSYLGKPQPLSINLGTNYTDMRHWFLIFEPQTCSARLSRAAVGQAVLQTRVTLSPTLGLSKSFSGNTYGSLRKYCKQKTYGTANSFKMQYSQKMPGRGPSHRFHSNASPFFSSVTKLQISQLFCLIFMQIGWEGTPLIPTR